MAIDDDARGLAAEALGALARMPVQPEALGVFGVGTDADTDAMNALLATCATNNTPIQLKAGKTYYWTKTLLWNHQRVGINGNNAIFDFSALPQNTAANRWQGVAIRTVGLQGASFLIQKDAPTHPMRDLVILGSNSQSFSTAGIIAKKGRTGLFLGDLTSFARGYTDFSANPSDGDTISAGSEIFRFKTSPDVYTYTDVQIGATLADTINNLVVGSVYAKYVRVWKEGTRVYWEHRAISGPSANGVALLSSGAAITTSGTFSGADGGSIVYAGNDVRLENVVIRGFEDAFEIGNNSYLLHGSCTQAYHNLCAFSAPAGLTNSGENLCFINSVFHSSTTGPRVSGIDLNLISPSLDYFEGHTILCTTGGRVNIESGHLENGASDLSPSGVADMAHWIYAIDNGSVVRINNSQLIQTSKVGGTRERKKEIFVADSNGSRIEVFGMGGFSCANGTYYLPNRLGLGQVIYRSVRYYPDVFDTDQVQAASWRNLFPSDCVNNLVNGRFAFGAISDMGRYDFIVRTGTNAAGSTAYAGYSGLSYDSSDKVGSTGNALVLTPPSGQTIRLERLMQCGPGSKPTFWFNIKGSSITTGSLTMWIEAINRAGGVTQISPTLTYNSAKLSSSYTKNIIRPTTIPSNNAQVLRLVIQATGSGTEVFKLSDLGEWYVEPSPAMIDRIMGQTFLPTIFGAGTAGTCTYTTQSGRFDTDGRKCWAEITLSWTGHTGTGRLCVGNLPVRNYYDTNLAQVIRVSGFVIDNTKRLQMFANGGDNYYQLIQVDNAGTETSFAIPSAGSISIVMEYTVG